MKKIKNDQFEVHQVDNTPFAVLDDKEKNEIWIILGNQKLMKVKSIEEAKKTVQCYKWDLLGPAIFTIATQAALQMYNNMFNQKEKNNGRNKNNQ